MTDFDSCIIFQKIATVAIFAYRLFVDFAVDFFIGFQWENGRIRNKMASKSSKISVGQQSTTY
jgi:hypothetical protein